MIATDFYHLKIHNVNTEEALTATQGFYEQADAKSIGFINAHCFNLSVKNKTYYNVLLQTDMVLNDGIGLKIASKFKGISLKENMNGTDFIPKLWEQSARLGKKVFLFGGEEGVAEQAKQNLEKQIPGIQIAGCRSGFFSLEQEKEVISEINNSRAELLIIGMGVPKQEIWLSENKSKLQHIKVAVPGGAIIDFTAGKVQRAPLWIQKIGLEWFFRFVQEPMRLFNRYFVGNFVFFLNCFQKFNHKF